jgi:hypothetical protein
MKHLIGLTLIGLLIPTAAFAGRCDEDKLKFCKDVQNVGACLDEHMDQLSKECRAKREETKAEMKGAPEQQKP